MALSGFITFFLFSLIGYVASVDLCISPSSNCPETETLCCFGIGQGDCCEYSPLGNNFMAYDYPRGSRAQIYGLGSQACTSYITTCPLATTDEYCCLENFADIASANWFYTSSKRDANPNPNPKVVYPNYLSYMVDGQKKEVAIPTGMQDIAAQALWSGNYTVFAKWKPFLK
ncbi:hypothetical protein GQ53DRAFT_887491 [Thozetella sp. PMI_491]|nr:hypothetical protein GQ53DRAFT_887491 [Thozetella sp. PMI_491]